MVGFRAWESFGRGSVLSLSWLGGRSVFSLSSLLVGFAVAGGCAGQSTGDTPDHCPDVCAKGNKCPGAMPLPESCDDTCLGQDALATESNCHDLYVKSIDCSYNLSNVCTALTDCKTQITAVQTCEMNYCAAHQTSDACIYLR